MKLSMQMQSKENTTPRRFSTRTKYLVNVLTKDNKPAHEVPLVLTFKGIANQEII